MNVRVVVIKQHHGKTRGFVTKTAPAVINKEEICAAEIKTVTVIVPVLNNGNNNSDS